jgi:hypothetical protein
MLKKEQKDRLKSEEILKILKVIFFNFIKLKTPIPSLIINLNKEISNRNLFVVV